VHTFTYVNAGHEPPFIVRCNVKSRVQTAFDEESGALPSPDDHMKNGRPEILNLEPGGLLLGIDPSAEYTPRVQAMNTGDILVCATDGVEEARNHRGELYRPERLTRIVSAHLEKSPEELHSLVMMNIEDFTGIEPQFDDTTRVIGKVV
jgi:serine phosphatase RsbU (regulator of sigma subunit)